MKPLRHLAAFMLLAASLGAGAQRLPAPAFAGRTVDGGSFELQAQRGRVVMVVMWKTECPVCIEKLPELRANAMGWKNAPFDLVLVSLDATPADAEAYERTRRLVEPQGAKIVPMWHGSAKLPPAWAQPGRLPRTVLVDREGRVAFTHEGRVPPELWNEVADLLP